MRYFYLFTSFHVQRILTKSVKQAQISTIGQTATDINDQKSW